MFYVGTLYPEVMWFGAIPLGIPSFQLEIAGP